MQCADFGPQVCIPLWMHVMGGIAMMLPQRLLSDKLA